ncbi:lytic transglycosylase domain-containing protein [Stenotrophomonas cyclobalanopsidis]
MRLAADTHGVEPSLLHAVIQVESGYNPKARSRAGAIGLMQVIPSTGRRFGATDLYDPAQNLQAGARYLAWLQRRFSGDLSLVLAAYNAGEGAVDRHGGRVPPYAETRAYVQKVIAIYHAARQASQ